MTDLSILILSYNTKNTTQHCLDELMKALGECETTTSEIIIVDNASHDGSIGMLEQFKKTHTTPCAIIANNKNVGFARANNQALTRAAGRYILFLNSDAMIKTVNFDDLLYYMDKNADVGALTVRLELPSGVIDLASHRGFPTLWRSFTYFSGLEHLLGKLPYFSSFFGGYHLLRLGLESIHEVEAISGAFYLTRKEILGKTGGFDERFFMYGEDLDLCYQIKKMGYKIIYYPLFTALHLKYQSGLKKTEKSTKQKTKAYFYDAMRMFYEKHFAHQHGTIINNLVYFLIGLKQKRAP